MNYKEFNDFSAGMVLNSKDTELKTNEVPFADNVDFSVKGVVRGAFALKKVYSSDFEDEVEDIFYQNLFGSGGLIVRAGDILYDDARPILFDCPNRYHAMVEYKGYVIIANGDANWKYKRRGIEGNWLAAFTSAFERTYGSHRLLTGLPFVNPLFYCKNGSYASFEWEVELVEGGSPISTGSDTITSSIERPYASGSAKWLKQPVEIGIYPPSYRIRKVAYIHDWEETFVDAGWPDLSANKKKVSKEKQDGDDWWKYFFSWEGNFLAEWFDLLFSDADEEKTNVASDDTDSTETDKRKVKERILYYVAFQNDRGFYSDGTYFGVGGGHRALLENIPVSDDPQVVARRLFKTAINGGSLYYLGTIPNGYTTTYRDRTADEELEDLMPTNHGKAPAAVDVTEHLSQLFMLVRPNYLYWPEGYDDWEYCPITNNEPFGGESADARKILTLGDELAVFLETTIWRRIGVLEADFAKKRSLANRGVFSYKAVASEGQLLFFVEKNGLFAYDTVRDLPMGKAIAVLFEKESQHAYALNRDYANRICSGFGDGFFLFSYPKTTAVQNDMAIIVNTYHQFFSFLSVSGINSFCFDDKGRKIYVAKGNNVYELIRAGSDLEAEERPGWAFEKDVSSELGGIELRKDFGFFKPYFNSKQGTIVIKVYVDDVLLHTFSFSAGEHKVARERLDVTSSGYRFKVRVEGTEDSEFYGFGLEFQIEGL